MTVLRNAVPCYSKYPSDFRSTRFENDLGDTAVISALDYDQKLCEDKRHDKQRWKREEWRGRRCFVWLRQKETDTKDRVRTGLTLCRQPLPPSTSSATTVVVTSCPDPLTRPANRRFRLVYTTVVGYISNQLLLG